MTVDDPADMPACDPASRTKGTDEIPLAGQVELGQDLTRELGAGAADCSSAVSSILEGVIRYSRGYDT